VKYEDEEDRGDKRDKGDMGHQSKFFLFLLISPSLVYLM
jgi:hypothetical protein